MSNAVTSEYMDYDGLKKTMEELNTAFDVYNNKIDSINTRISTDINAGVDSALDSTVLGTNASLAWDDLSIKFKNFKSTFDVIYRGVAESSSADEAFENLAKITFNTDGTIKSPGSDAGASNAALTNASYQNVQY